MLDGSEAFRADVGNHVVCWAVADVDELRSHCMTNEVVLQGDVLCTRVANGILSQSNGTLIITAKS
jgi:hypothetical protein